MAVGDTITLKMEEGALVGFPLNVPSGDNINAWGGMLYADPKGKFDSKTRFFDRKRGTSGLDVSNIKTEDGTVIALAAGDPVLFGVTTKDESLKYGKSTETLAAVVQSVSPTQLVLIVAENSNDALSKAGKGLTPDEKRAKLNSDIAYHEEKLAACRQALANLNLSDDSIPF